MDEIDGPSSANCSINESSSQFNVQTLEMSLSVKVQFEVDYVVATVKTKGYDAILPRTDNLFARCVEHTEIRFTLVQLKFLAVWC